MKDETSRRWFAITADQRRSRTSADMVPQALTSLARIPGLALPFERTAGDEIQGLTSDPETVVAAVCALARTGGFRIGIGVGDVDEPLPTSTREARGGAYLAAREAVSQHAQSVRVVVQPPAPPRTPTPEDWRAVDAETALLALVSSLQRRSAEGWEVVDLIETGLTGTQTAARLGISASAVSQRLKSADHALVVRLIGLSGRLLAGVWS